jgi:hypothetical protein
MKLFRYALFVILTAVMKVKVLLDVRQYQQVNIKQLFSRYLRNFRRSVTPPSAGTNSPIRGTILNSVLTDTDLYPVTGLGPVRASTPFRPGTGSAAGLEWLCYFLNMTRWTQSRNIGFIKLKLLSEAITALNSDNVRILVRKPPTFRRVRKTAKSSYQLRNIRLSVCLPVHMERVE